MSTELIVIANFRFPTDPDFVMFVTELEQEGIEYVCPERTQLEVDPLMSMAFGGLRVLVQEKDATRAREILASITDAEVAEPDEADEEISRMKSEEAGALQRNYRSCLIAVAVLVLIALIINVIAKF